MKDFLLYLSKREDDLIKMFNSAVYLKNVNNLIRISFTASIFMAFAAVGANGFGSPVPQQTPPKLGDSVYKNNKKSSDEPKKVIKKKPKPAVTKNNAATTNKIVSIKKSTPPKAFLDVTFLAKEPLVEVYLNEKSIGATDANFKLSKKLTPGDYTLMAKNKRQVLMSTKKINISPSQTVFKLFEEIVPKPAPVVEKPVEKTEKSDMEKMVEISAEVKRILAAYSDPATTDSVSTDDWQLVFQAAQLGQLQNYTAVQIEAQRWFASGQIELANGDFNNAFTAFTKSQEYMPTSALPFYGLGNTYLAKKQYQDALRAFQKAVQTDPQMAMAHKKLGDTLRLLGKEKEAIVAYKQAINNGYRTPETRFWLGTLMLDTKQTEEAVGELEEVAKVMPRAEVFISIGDGYLKLKRQVSALEAYQKAVDADPNSALAHYKLADLYEEQREYTKAKDAYEKAIALDPEGKTVNKNETQKKLREVTNKLNK